ncbi:type III pantothenate kinase [Egicoccus halophilus]|uniref:Type III pantothenate kinase n=1 Tax=Egicoccus halophilus TaxID=1670830 RepID=A0A8J3EVB3_9ACTN|nr:type III pantothenate kinase [Egicoccus halophilus]GGI07774.1 type III pantothenate kinase [Egicoccus halophilus]
MLLALDVGNSNTVVGVYDGEDLVRHWRLKTDVDRTSDEFVLALAGFLDFAGIDLLTDVDGLVAGSVVPTVTEVVREMAARHLPFAPVVVEPGVRTGISLRHDQPQDIGADRIVNAVAAHARYDTAAVVVDFGTATSFDVVSADGAFVGGAIAPGVHVSAEALVQRAARLPKVATVAPPSPIGRSTVTALQAGIVYGFAGQVDGIVRRILTELGGEVATIATGGAAPAVLSACETIDTYDPWLTLEGLRLIWHRNP